MPCLTVLAIISKMVVTSKSSTHQFFIRSLLTASAILAIAASISLLDALKLPLSAQQISNNDLNRLATTSMQSIKSLNLPKEKFSISAPSNWITKEATLPYIYKASTPQNEADVHVTVGDCDDDSSASFAKSVIFYLRKDPDISVENCSDQEVLISGVKAIRRQQTLVIKGSRIWQLCYYIVKSGKAFGFNASTDERTGKILTPVFDKMATSIQINESPSFSPTGISAGAPIRDKWALVVGISQFQDKRIPSLKYAAKDARDFRDFLVKEANFAPDHVRLLLNEKATERQVVSELGNKFLARVAKEGDLIVLYFSTHGSPSKADLKGKNYLVAYDSDKDDLYASGIEMQKIVETLNDRVDSTRTLLVLDACHSGATTAGTKGMEDASNFSAEELAQGSGKLVICSSAPDQKSWESMRYQNGIFTRKLIEGLRMNGKKTKLGDAFSFVSKSVKSEVQEDQATKQEPILRSKWDGNDLTLAVPASEPQALPVSVKSILGPDSTQTAPQNSSTIKRTQHK